MVNYLKAWGIYMRMIFTMPISRYPYFYKAHFRNLRDGYRILRTWRFALILAMLLSSHAHAFSDYEALHDCAHFGAGVAVGAVMQTVMQATGMRKAYPLTSDLLVLGISAFAASAKEDSDAAWNWEQWGCTVAGGAVATRIVWRW